MQKDTSPKTFYNNTQSGFIFETNLGKARLYQDGTSFYLEVNGTVIWQATSGGVSDDTINVNTINELTAGNGVTIDGVLIKDAAFDTNVVAAGLTLSGTTLAADGTDAAISITLNPKGVGSVLSIAGTVAHPTYSFTADPDTGIYDSGANVLGFVTNGTERWVVNASGALNPSADNSYDIGNAAVNPRSIGVSTSFDEYAKLTEGYGIMSLKYKQSTKTLTNAQTNVIVVQVPAGAKIIGCQLRNDTIIAGVDDATGLTPITSYAALYSTGATQSIGATVLVAKNTKTNKMFDSNAATDITSGATDVTVDSGVGNKFTAGGKITAVVYYYELTSITSAS